MSFTTAGTTREAKVRPSSFQLLPGLTLATTRSVDAGKTWSKLKPVEEPETEADCNFYEITRSAKHQNIKNSLIQIWRGSSESRWVPASTWGQNILVLWLEPRQPPPKQWPIVQVGKLHCLLKTFEHTGRTCSWMRASGCDGRTIGDPASVVVEWLSLLGGGGSFC